MSAETVVDQTVQTQITKCDACGANMLFHPDTHTLYCEHCGSHQRIKNETDAEEQDIRFAFLEQDNAEDAHKSVVFTCENCGAKVTMVEGETAKSCPFCGTAHVTATEEFEGLKPNAVLPFAFGKERAIEFGKAWARKRLFAPRKFKKTLKGEGINGVYAPAFTFDSQTTSSYVGRIGTRHTRTVGYGKNQRVETYIIWRTISGTFNQFFNDILISAGSKFDQKKMQSISPYYTDGSVTYSEEYLLGYMSYRHEESIDDCWSVARSTMDSAIRRGILRQYTYNVLDYLNVSTSHADVTYKYVLLPVYVGNFKYGKKLYNYYVNGCSGKVKGKAPVSPWRVLFTTLLGIGVAVGLYFLITLLL